MIVRVLKQGIFGAAHTVGLSSAVASSGWRSRRLLILCYHGISLRDEDEWRPSLFMAPDVFAARMETIARGGYAVLSLEEGLERLRSGTLPRKAVALTFDDGTVDFARLAYPILRRHAFPATVYLYTRYAGTGYPASPPIASYILWKARGRIATPDGILDGASPSDAPITTDSAAARDAQMRRLDASLRSGTLEERDARVVLLAERLGVDYQEIRQAGLLQIMGSDELRSLDRSLVDVQLHTHNHITPPTDGPPDAGLYEDELASNRAAIAELLGEQQDASQDRRPHFCYPSGELRPQLPAILRRAGIRTATTCRSGLASVASDPLLLPRFVDTQLTPARTFESWLSGFAALLPRRT